MAHYMRKFIIVKVKFEMLVFHNRLGGGGTKCASRTVNDLKVKIFRMAISARGSILVSSGRNNK
jgi:hypothetical protein